MNISKSNDKVQVIIESFRRFCNPEEENSVVHGDKSWPRLKACATQIMNELNLEGYELVRVDQRKEYNLFQKQFSFSVKINNDTQFLKNGGTVNEAIERFQKGVTWVYEAANGMFKQNNVKINTYRILKDLLLGIKQNDIVLKYNISKQRVSRIKSDAILGGFEELKKEIK